MAFERSRRRGSFFFVLDAFLAASILVFTLVLIFSFHAESSRTHQSFAYAQDYLAFLTTTQVNDYRVAGVTALIADGAIENPHVTLAEQALIFANRSDLVHAGSLLSAAAENIPSAVDIEVTVFRNGTMEEPLELYSRLSGSDRSAKQTHLSAKSLVYTVVDQNALYGPFILEVETWT